MLPVKSGTRIWPFASAETTSAAGHIPVGGVVSDTVKVVVHDVLLPTASVTVTVITCVPKPTEVPA
jgi:hypothetical protein